MSQPKAEIFYGVRLPAELADLLNRAVQAEDTDKSKFIRNAIRAHLATRGYGEVVKGERRAVRLSPAGAAA